MNSHVLTDRRGPQQSPVLAVRKGCLGGLARAGPAVSPTALEASKGRRRPRGPSRACPYGGMVGWSGRWRPKTPVSPGGGSDWGSGVSPHCGHFHTGRGASPAFPRASRPFPPGLASGLGAPRCVAPWGETLAGQCFRQAHRKTAQHYALLRAASHNYGQGRPVGPSLHPANRWLMFISHRFSSFWVESCRAGCAVVAKFRPRGNPRRNFKELSPAGGCCLVCCCLVLLFCVGGILAPRPDFQKKIKKKIKKILKLTPM